MVEIQTWKWIKLFFYKNTIIFRAVNKSFDEENYVWNKDVQSFSDSPRVPFHTAEAITWV